MSVSQYSGLWCEWQILNVPPRRNRHTTSDVIAHSGSLRLIISPCVICTGVLEELGLENTIFFFFTPPPFLSFQCNWTLLYWPCWATGFFCQPHKRDKVGAGKAVMSNSSYSVTYGAAVVWGSFQRQWGPSKTPSLIEFPGAGLLPRL